MKTLILILVLATAALLIGVNRPFTGHHDANNKMYRVAALNYLTKPIGVHKFGQLIDGNFYTHHPILLPITLAASIQLFGDHFWSIRLVPIIFSVATLGVFYFILRSFFKPQVAIIALLFWIITPMFLYFGKMADHEALTLFFIVLAVYGFIKKNNRLVILAVVLGQWTGWPAYYLAFILAVFMRSWILLVISLVNFGLFASHISALTGSPIGGGLVDIFLFRTGAKASVGRIVESYSMIDFLKQELSWTYHFFTPIQFFLAAAAVFLTEKKLTLKNKVWFIFLFVPIVHVFLFRTGAHRHDYWLYYFLPFFSFGVAITMNYLLDKMKKPKIVYALFIILLIIAFLRSMPFFWALQTRIEL